jgi:hypothetical protein
MNKVLRDRVSLIRAMYNVLKADSERYHYNDAQHEEFRRIIQIIRNNENNHFLSVSQDAPMQISYARCPEDKFNTKRRIRVALGKYIIRNLNPNMDVLSDHTLANFVSGVWGIYRSGSVDVKILVGKDIVEAYRAFGDSDAHSCMTGSSCQYTNFYALNPDKVCMVILDEIRALLWHTDPTPDCPNGKTVLDRCYPSGHGKIEILREWANKKGYVLRRNPDRLVTGNVELSDDKIYEVTMKCSKEYPYIDTFAFGRFDSDRNQVVLTNAHEDQEIEFHTTNGGYDCLGSRYVCENCNDSVEDDDARLVDGVCYCDRCYDDLFTECHECGDTILVEDAFCDDSYGYCSSCFHDKFFHCPKCSEVTAIEDGVLNSSTDECWCKSCVEDHLYYCEFCELYYDRREIVIDSNEGCCCCNCVKECSQCGCDISPDTDMCSDCKKKPEEETEEETEEGTMRSQSTHNVEQPLSVIA